jgi:hypothetical protein
MKTQSRSISDYAKTNDLKSLFCQRFGCPPVEFEKHALQKCLYPQARIVAPLLRLLNPRCLERDRAFINHLGSAKTWDEVTAQISALHYQDGVEPRFARSTLGLRVSGRKATRLAASLFKS